MARPIGFPFFIEPRLAIVSVLITLSIAIAAAFAFHVGHAAHPVSDDDTGPQSGTGGSVPVTFSERGAVLSAVKVLPDGRVLVAGTDGVPWQDSIGNFGLARLHPGGPFDTTFGTGGKVVTSFDVNRVEAKAMIVQSDGKIVVAGQSYGRSPLFLWDAAVARYLPDGGPDPTFGDNGKLIVDLGSNSDEMNAITQQSDGKLLAVGTVGGDMAVVRLNEDGSLDDTFGNDGIAKAGFSVGRGLAIIPYRPGGQRIIVAGYTQAVPGRVDVALAAFDLQGNLDQSFGTGGRLTDTYNTHSTGRGLAWVSDDPQDERFTLVGTSNFGIVHHYLPNGELDMSRGENGGWSYLNPCSPPAACGYVLNDIEVLPTGQMLACGDVRQFSPTFRESVGCTLFNENGVRDPEFCETGTCQYSGMTATRDFEIDDQGNAYLAGFLSENGTVNGLLFKTPINNITVPVGNADLEVSLTATPDTPRPGEQFVMEVVVTNHGPDTAGGVNGQYNAAPATFISCSGHSLTCVSPGHFGIDNMVAGTSGSNLVTLSLPPDIEPGTVLTFTANVASATADPDPSNNQKSIDITVGAPEPQPPTIEWISPSSGPPGTNITISGQNMSDAQVEFNDILAEIFSNTATEVRAIVPEMNDGVATVTVRTVNGMDSGVFMVVRGTPAEWADVSVTKTVSNSIDGPYKVGVLVYYTITVTNSMESTVDALNVLVQDQLPMSLERCLKRASNGNLQEIRQDSECNKTTNSFRLNIRRLGIGETQTYVLEGRPSVLGTYSNVVEALPATHDPDLTNNSAEAVFTVICRSSEIEFLTNQSRYKKGTAFSDYWRAVGLDPPLTWSISGNPPPGITFFPNPEIHIELYGIGTFESTGTFVFVVGAVDSAGCRAYGVNSFKITGGPPN